MRIDRTMQAIYQHASDSYPEECCGVVTVAGDAVPLKNVSRTPTTSFEISSRDYLAYCHGALCVYHSHPDRKAVFSDADKAFFERSRIPLVVVSWPAGEIRVLGLPGEGSPLLGRPFIYGIYDCYALARDFYRRELGIEVQQITRPRFGWWKSGELDPFSDGISTCGMVDCANLAYGDIILLSLNGSPVSNHIGIYMGNNMFLHHGVLALSSYVEYGQRYRDATTRTLRHVNRS
jgi:proteasome lid subunit RPN8/RPN11